MNAEVFDSGPQLAAPHSMSVQETALIQRARRVPLPEHVAYAKPGKPYVHPIQRFIRNTFRLNRADTSTRLVTAAMDNGHKFLDLLSAAQTPASEAHASIVQYLEKHPPPPRRPPPPPHLRPGGASQRNGRIHRLFRPKSGPPPQAPVVLPATATEIPPWTSPNLPLITRRMIAGSETTVSATELTMTATTTTPPPPPVSTYFYEYVPTQGSRPLADLPRRRLVPRLITEASGIPFLRMGRPQPPVLSRLLRIKGQRRRARAELASRLSRTGMVLAAQEDAWEANLARGLAAAGERPGPEAAGGQVSAASEKRETYRRSVAVGIAYLSNQLNVEMADMLARGKAYLQIVDRERALAQQEDREREAREAKEAQEAQEAQQAPDAAGKQEE